MRYFPSKTFRKRLALSFHDGATRLEEEKYVGMNPLKSLEESALLELQIRTLLLSTFHHPNNKVRLILIFNFQLLTSTMGPTHEITNRSSSFGMCRRQWRNSPQFKDQFDVIRMSLTPFWRDRSEIETRPSHASMSRHVVEQCDDVAASR